MLNHEQLQQFETHGFLVVADVVDASQRQLLRDEYALLVNQLAERRGHAADDWNALNFEQKLARLMARDPEAYEYLDISLPLKEGLDETSGMHLGPAVFGLLTSARILDVVESIVGPEIVSNPVQHVRIKPPESILNESGRGNSNMGRTGWHQDAAVIVEDADSSPMLTVWVAVSDATTQMGCMQAIPGSHRWPALSMHCPGKKGIGEIFIPNELIDEHEPVNLEAKAGSVVLLHKKTWHGAGPNCSEKIRWSFDLRYQPPGFNTGRECFPSFLARSQASPDKVLTSAEEWALQWKSARTEITNGSRSAVFNERWRRFRNDPLCA